MNDNVHIPSSMLKKHHTTHTAITNTRKKRTRMKPENQTKVSNKKTYRNSS